MMTVKIDETGVTVEFSEPEVMDEFETELEAELDDPEAEVEAALEVLEEFFAHHIGARLALEVLRTAFDAGEVN